MKILYSAEKKNKTLNTYLPKKNKNEIRSKVFMYWADRWRIDWPIKIQFSRPRGVLFVHNVRLQLLPSQLFVCLFCCDC